MAKNSFYQNKEIQYIEKLRELLSELPSFVKTYMRGIEPTTAQRTRLAYAGDLKVFFEYLVKNNALCKGMKINEIPFEILTKLEAIDIEEYLEYLKLYKDEDGNIYTNDEKALKRKLSALRGLFKYFHSRQFMDTNPTLQVKTPKLHDHVIVRMDEDEIESFLDTVETGNNMTDHQLYYHEKNRLRDICLTTLLLSTGMRVTECVGIDINDIDLENQKIKITRKGGNEAFIYFGEEALLPLLDYYEHRKKIIAEEGHEQAFFLSNRNKRISVRNVEVLIKEYAKRSSTAKKITPHKLRSTYGTALYKATEDIYLVAEVLGHKDVNTTRKHYAALDEERKKNARDAVVLRQNKSDDE